MEIQSFMLWLKTFWLENDYNLFEKNVLIIVLS